MSRSVIHRADGGEEEIPSKIVTTLREGDRVVSQTAGGGGYGDPAGRDPAARAADVADGKVSEEAGKTTAARRREAPRNNRHPDSLPRL